MRYLTVKNETIRKQQKQVIFILQFSAFHQIIFIGNKAHLIYSVFGACQLDRLGLDFSKWMKISVCFSQQALLCEVLLEPSHP